MPWGFAAVAGASILGAGVSALGATSAANTQANASENATQAQLQMFNTVQGNLEPYNQFGQSALNPLSGLLGIGNNGIGASAQMQSTLAGMPGYQFTLGQGLESVQNSAAARGLGSSGAALKGAASYATGLAQSNYNQYYNQLLGATQLGGNAAAGVGNAATAAGSGIASTIQNAGNAQAAGILGTTNSVNNALGTLGNTALTNQLLNNGGGYGYGSVPTNAQLDTQLGSLPAVSGYQF